MQANARHRAIAVLNTCGAQRLPHRFDAGCEKCNVVNDARSRRRQGLVAEIGGESVRVVGIDADDVDGAEVSLVAAPVEPGAGEVEGRPVAAPETEDLLVETTGFLEIGG